MTDDIRSSEQESASAQRAVARRRVVVTGLGLINPIGMTVESFWESLTAERSGIRPITLFDCSKLPTRFAGEVTDFNARLYLAKEERKSLKVMARAIQMAVAAAQLAMDDAGADKDKLDSTRFGVEFGSGLLASELQELAMASYASTDLQSGEVDLAKWGEYGISTIQPLWMLKYLPNMLACHVSILQNAQGPNNTITESDVASLLALGEAFHILRRDQADIFLVGGADSKVNPLSMVRQSLWGRLSQRNDAPAQASRPFDKNRDGFVVGEGAAVFVVEDLNHAQSRNARIYAEILGFGAAFDRDRSGRGLARAMRLALDQARLSPDDIDHLNAHGLGSIPVDIWECSGVNEVFGNRREPLPVFAAKSYFGNLGAASATSELAASILASRHNLLPATLNYETPDPKCAVSVTRRRQPINKPYAMKLSFTDLGQCAALIYRKWE